MWIKGYKFNKIQKREVLKYLILRPVLDNPFRQVSGWGEKGSDSYVWDSDNEWLMEHEFWFEKNKLKDNPIYCCRKIKS